MKRFLWIGIALLALGCTTTVFRQALTTEAPAPHTLAVTSYPTLDPTATPVDVPPSPTPELPAVTATLAASPTPTPNPYLALLSTQTLPELDLAALTRYTVILTRTESSGRVFVARAGVRYVNTSSAPLSEVVLRLYPNTPGYRGALDLQLLKVDGVAVAPAFELESTVVRVPLAASLPPGHVVALDAHYTLRIPDGNRAGYGALNCSGGVCSLGGFYPAVAVNRDGEWHYDLVTGVGDPVYAETALFDVTITVPAGHAVLGSGRVVEQVSVAEDQVTWRIVGGPVRDFALVVGAGYTTVEQNLGDVLVTYSYYLPSETQTISQVVSYAVSALAIYGDLFTPYPYTSLALVEAPIAASGLEYPGAILLGSRAFSQGGEWLELVVAHEVAHQWWYGLVGIDQVNEAWLDEGLASYTSILYFRAQHGAMEADRIMNAYYRRPYQSYGWALQTMPANLPVTAYTAQTYSPVVYVRATNFFGALHEAMGEDSFVALLQEFAGLHRWRLASGEDFMSLARKHAPERAPGLYAYWIRGER